MPLEPTSGNDAGLLQVIASIRQGCDMLAKAIADHGAQHDHGLNQCARGCLTASSVLQGIGAVGTANAAELLEAFVDMVDGDEDEDDAHTA